MKPAPKMNPDNARAAFLRWMRAKHPAFYSQVAQGAGIGDLGVDATPPANVFSQILNSANSLLSQYVTSKAQLAQLKINVKRAGAGLPPVTGEPTMQPAPQSFFSTVPMWAWIAGGAGLLYLLTRGK